MAGFTVTRRGLADGHGERLTLRQLPPSTVTDGSRFNVVSNGAKGDFAADDTTAFQATIAQALANGGGVPFAPAGHYKLTGQLAVTASYVVIDTAPGAILDFSTVNLGVGVPYLSFIGSDGTTVNLTQNIAAGADVLQVAPGSEPADGTYVRLGSTAFWSGGPQNASSPPLYNSGVNEKRGEHRIVSMPTGTLASTMLIGDTSLTLTNTGNDARVASRWPNSAFVLKIDSELITVPANAVSVSTSTVTISGVTRGVAAQHNSGAGVALAPGYVGLTIPADDGYNTADAAFITPETFLNQVGITGHGRIIGPGFGTGSIGVEYDRCKHVLGSHGLTYVNWDLRVVSMSDVIETPGFDAPSIYGGKSAQNEFYGIASQYACQDVTINGGYVQDCRHAFTTTGGGTGKSGISRRIKVIGMHAANTTSHSFDTHPAGEDISFVDCTTENSADNGFNMRCPNAKILGGHVKYARGFGARLRNQSSQPTRYIVDGLTVQSSSGNGILYAPDGSITTLLSTILIGDTPPFNITVASTADWSSSGTLQIDSEWMTYTNVDATHFTINARAQNLSVAAGHAINATVFDSLHGIGSNIDYIILDNIAVQDVGYRGFSYASVRAYSNDSFPLTNIRIGTIHVKNQEGATSSAAALQLQNVQDSSVDRIIVTGHPANADAIQLQNCQNVTVRNPRAEWLSRGTGRLVRIDSGYPWGAASLANEVAFPSTVNAGTGISIDSTVKATRLRAIEAVSEATTPLSDGGNSVLDGGASRAAMARDYGYVTWAFPPEQIQSNTPLTPAGTVNLIRVTVPFTQKVTNIVGYVGTGGSGLTAGQCFAALYSVVAGTAALGVTADQATAWASVGTQTMAIAGGPITVTAGDYWVALWYNGTTGPAFDRGVNQSVIQSASSGSRWAVANAGVTTTPPASLSGITGTGVAVAYWAALS